MSDANRDLTCKWCGSEFERPYSMGPAPAYCSASHRQRAYEDRRLNEAKAAKTAQVEQLREENAWLRDQCKSLEREVATLEREVSAAYQDLDYERSQW